MFDEVAWAEERFLNTYLNPHERRQWDKLRHLPNRLQGYTTLVPTKWIENDAHFFSDQWSALNRLQIQRTQAVTAAAAREPSEFRPWFYRVRVSPRKFKRYRMPGIASRVSTQEARTIQALRASQRLSISELARRFHRKRETVGRILRDPGFQSFLNGGGWPSAPAV